MNLKAWRKYGLIMLVVAVATSLGASLGMQWQRQHRKAVHWGFDPDHYLFEEHPLPPGMSLRDFLTSNNVHFNNASKAVAALNGKYPVQGGDTCVLVKVKESKSFHDYLVVLAPGDEYYVVSLKPEFLAAAHPYPKAIQRKAFREKRWVMIAHQRAGSSEESPANSMELQFAQQTQGRMELIPKLSEALGSRFPWGFLLESPYVRKVELGFCYEEERMANQILATGPVMGLFVRINDSASYYSFPFTRKGKVTYYDEEGVAVSRDFMKDPLVLYKKISREYGYYADPVPEKRYEVTGKYPEGEQLHAAVDYAAEVATPVLAVSDGKIYYAIPDPAKPNCGGIQVGIRHDEGYATQYLHLHSLNKLAFSAGYEISQGDVLGYVGQTGCANGPHVCFRLKKGNTDLNPMILRGGKFDPHRLSGQEREDFLELIRPLRAAIDSAFSLAVQG